MKITGKLLELVNDGEGHTIWKDETVINGLADNKIGFHREKNGIHISLDGRTSVIPITLPPDHPPKSKYDIVSWVGGKGSVGVWDLDLISSITDLVGDRNQVRGCLGRGYQYRAYRDYLVEKGFINDKKTG